MFCRQTYIQIFVFFFQYDGIYVTLRLYDPYIEISVRFYAALYECAGACVRVCMLMYGWWIRCGSVCEYVVVRYKNLSTNEHWPMYACICACMKTNFYFQTEQCFSFLSSITHRYSNIPKKSLREEKSLFHFVKKIIKKNFLPVNWYLFGAERKKNLWFSNRLTYA